jgi:L-2-hydroxycarboxylate dehydrogenase (NAD+)
MPAVEAKIFPIEALREFSTRIFLHFGVPQPDAVQAADVLASADLRGIDSHGVALIVLYAQMRAERRIEFRPDARVLRESPVTALIDGGNGLGHVPSTQAMQ